MVIAFRGGDRKRLAEFMHAGIGPSSSGIAAGLLVRGARWLAVASGCQQLCDTMHAFTNAELR